MAQGRLPAQPANSKLTQEDWRQLSREDQLQHQTLCEKSKVDNRSNAAKIAKAGLATGQRTLSFGGATGQRSAGAGASPSAPGARGGRRRSSERRQRLLQAPSTPAEVGCGGADADVGPSTSAPGAAPTMVTLRDSRWDVDVTCPPASPPAGTNLLDDQGGAAQFPISEPHTQDMEVIAGEKTKRKYKQNRAGGRCRKCGREWQSAEWKEFHVFESSSNLMYSGGAPHTVCMVAPEQWAPGFPVAEGERLPKRV